MRSLIRLLLKNYAVLLFVFLEVISLVLIFNFNSFQRSKFLNSSNVVSSTVYDSFSSVVQYFKLGKVNRSLSEENARLRNTLQYYQEKDELEKEGVEPYDTTFRYIPARIINSSVNKQHNYITLNKGRKHGVKQDQGIISGDGIVGIVVNVTESYSMGLSLLNPSWSVSAKLKKSGFYGPLIWNGKDYRKAELREIPFHIKLDVGDTIVTSGYSSVFPEGLLIGTIDTYAQPTGENYYKIEVLLSADFKSATYVEIIENKDIEELQELKTITEDGKAGN